MTRKTGVYVQKYMVYVLVVLIAFVLQETPALFSIFGIKPLLVVPAAVCIAMFEGEFAGGLIGAFAGILCDMGGITIFGFNGLIMLVSCAVCGLIIIFWLRRNVLSALLLCSVVLLIRASLEYFVCIAMWGYEGMGYYYLRYTLPCVIYSSVASPFIFFAVKKIHEKFEEKLV